MVEEICPIRPIHLSGQLEHLNGNIIPCQRNIAKFGTKQTFLFSSQGGISSVDLGGAAYFHSAISASSSVQRCSSALAIDTLAVSIAAASTSRSSSSATICSSSRRMRPLLDRCNWGNSEA